jgi:putative membrane protein
MQRPKPIPGGISFEASLLKEFIMKKILLGLLTAPLFLALSCNSASNDDVKEAKKFNDKKVDSATLQQSVTDSTAVTSKQDASFLVDAAAGGQLEVQLGLLAQKNASSPGVKSFGAMMIRDHGKGGNELRSLAMAKRVTLSDTISDDQKKAVKDLESKSGPDFDKAYINYMVKDHKEDIGDFEKAAQNANDPDVKAFANNHLPMLHQHLDSAQSLQQQGKSK